MKRFTAPLAEFFTPPVFPENAEQTLVASALYAILYILFTCLAVILVVIDQFFIHQTNFSLLTQLLLLAVAFLVVVAVLYTARRGSLHLAAWILVSTLWVATLLSTIPAGGINAVSFGGIAAILLAAGVLIGMNGALFFFTLTILAGVLLALVDQFGLLPATDHTLSPLSAFITYSAIFSSAIGTLHIATSTVRKANQQLQLELNERQRYEKALQEKELGYRSLIEDAPDGILILDEGGKILIANTSACQILGAQTLEQIDPRTTQWLTDDTHSRKLFGDLLSAGQSIKIEERLEISGPAELWIEGSLKMLPDRRLQFIFKDITERKLNENALLLRDDVLEAVAFAAAQFLSGPEWNTHIDAVLERLGQGLHVSHAYLFENHVNVLGEAVTSMRYEWTAAGQVSDLGNPLYQNSLINRPGYERSCRVLTAGQPYIGDVAHFDPAEQEVIEKLGMKAVLDMPVFVNQQWWGTLGFDDMQRPRIWLQPEIDALKVAANIISVAIERQLADSERRSSEQIYRRAIESIGAVPYLQRYSDNRYVFVGERIFDLVGLHPEEFTPANWDALVKESIMMGEAAGLSIAEAVRRTRTGAIKVWKCDSRILTPNGETRWISDTAVEIYNEQGISTRSLGIFQDVTDRKLIEAQTRQLNTELERRVDERTAQLAAANKELEAFSYSVSHDLRAPLRAMRGFSQIILEDYGAILPDEGKNLLGRVIGAAGKMSELIDVLLAFSRLARIEMNYTTVDLSAAALNALKELQLADPGRLVSFHVTPNLAAFGDEQLLSTVMTNLIDNAWKYTRKTQAAEIEFGCLQIDGAPAFYVRDNGVGFDMAFAGNIFSAFQRLHPQNEFPGHGIGLATVQRIINRHGGKIWAEARPDQGATFYFTIPDAR